jgi:hypothetical protein
MGGTHLVFVRYDVNVNPFDWVQNMADLQTTPVVWARDLGSRENSTLRTVYRSRTCWTVDARTTEPKLRPCEDQSLIKEAAQR